MAALGLLPLLACGGGEPPAALDASPQPPASWSLIRLPQDGGNAERLTLPRLTVDPWTPRSRLPALAGIVGVDPDLPAAYLLRKDGGVVSLDLEAGSVRVVDPVARHAALGADQTLYTINPAGAAAAWVRRSARDLRGRVDGAPALLAGTVGDELVVVAASGEPRAQLLSADAEPMPEALAPGPVAASTWGDQVVAAGPGTLTWWSTRSQDRREVRLREEAVDVAVSPSGHAAWVLASEGTLVRYDRQTGRRHEAVELPGRGAALRMDPHGRWLLVRRDGEEGIWVVDTASDSLVTAVAAPWGSDLPTVAAARLLVTRAGRDVVALDLDAAGAPETGRVRGGARSLWLVAPRPRPGSQQAAAEPAAVAQASGSDDATPADSPATDAPEDPGSLYLQLSSSRNPEWAEDLARQLRAADVRASVLPASPVDNLYRVVVGPFATREDAEAVARSLGRPSFIFQRPDGTP